MGSGCGIVLLAGATTGGTTTAVRLLCIRFPKLKLGNLLILLDGVIIAAGAILLHDAVGFIASIVYETVTCWIINVVVYGFTRKGRKEE